MSRFEIVNGELLQSYEPHDLPGAFIVTRHKVTDPTGAVPSEAIQWSGPGEWPVYQPDGVPDGYLALVLGARNATRSFVVHVEREPTADTATYERGYRRGFTAKRSPTIKVSASRPEIEGVLDGWRDRCQHHATKH